MDVEKDNSMTPLPDPVVPGHDHFTDLRSDCGHATYLKARDGQGGRFRGFWSPSL